MFLVFLVFVLFVGMDGEFAGRQRHLKEAAARGRTAEARELLLARDETLWRDGVDAQKTSLLAASLV